MKIIKNILENKINIRTQKDYPIEGVEFIDITPLILEKNVLGEIIDEFLKELENKDIDYIVVPEARGFLLGVAIAKQLNIGCIPVRKKGKLPPIAVETQFEYEKEYGKDILELPKLLNETYEGKNMYIIDDIYATGNTINSIEAAIEKLGGKVVGKGVIMKILGLSKDDNIFSLMDVEEE